MKESAIEKYLTEQVKLRLKGEACKFKSRVGDPDRLILFPPNCAAFIETKRPGKTPRVEQTRRHKNLRQLGFKVYCCDTKESVNNAIDELRQWQQTLEV